MSAYGLAVTVKYRDGSSEVVAGMGQDLILGLYLNRDDEGPIQPGSQRETPQWNLGTTGEGAHLVASWRGAKVSSIIFMDNSTAGEDDAQIDRTFFNRQVDLREYRFWLDTFQFYKPELPSLKSMSELIPLAKSRRLAVATTHADDMQGSLEFLDYKVTSGSMTRQEAIVWQEKRLTWLVTTLEQHAEHPHRR